MSRRIREELWQELQLSDGRDGGHGRGVTSSSHGSGTASLLVNDYMRNHPTNKSIVGNREPISCQLLTRFGSSATQPKLTSSSTSLPAFHNSPIRF